MVSDKKYKFGTSVFRIVSPCLLKENASYRSFLAEDTVKEDYLYEICPVQANIESDRIPSLQVKRDGNRFKVSVAGNNCRKPVQRSGDGKDFTGTG